MLPVPNLTVIELLLYNLKMLEEKKSVISYLDLHRRERDPKATNTDIISLYRSFFKEYVQLLRNDSSEASGFNCCSG